MSISNQADGENVHHSLTVTSRSEMGKLLTARFVDNAFRHALR